MVLNGQSRSFDGLAQSMFLLFTSVVSGIRRKRGKSFGQKKTQSRTSRTKKRPRSVFLYWHEMSRCVCECTRVFSYETGFWSMSDFKYSVCVCVYDCFFFTHMNLVLVQLRSHRLSWFEMYWRIWHMAINLSSSIKCPLTLFQMIYQNYFTNEIHIAEKNERCRVALSSLYGDGLLGGENKFIYTMEEHFFFFAYSILEFNEKFRILWWNCQYEQRILFCCDGTHTTLNISKVAY